jgi:hypothetical protein
MATTFNNLGRIAGLRGDYDRGRALIGEGFAIVDELGDKTAIGFFLNTLGLIAARSGDYDVAIRRYAEALEAFREVDSRQYIGEVLESVASVATVLGNVRRAARLIGAAATIREALGVPLPSDDEIQVEADLDAIRRALGPTDAERTIDEGRAMSLYDAVAYAVDYASDRDS